MNLERTVRVIFLAAACGVAQAQQQKPAQPQQQTQPQQPQPKSGAEANPFPGDLSNVPVISNNGAAAAAAEAAPPANLPPEADPVRSPDQADGDSASSSSDGFSSSSSAFKHEPQINDADNTASGNVPKGQNKVPGILNRNVKPPTDHTETAAEDENVGGYYLSTKNWRAALSRFQSAMVLDPENPEVYWGLAEAQYHLGDLAGAKANYQMVVAYDPGSRHGKDAKKMLAEPEFSNIAAKK